MIEYLKDGRPKADYYMRLLEHRVPRLAERTLDEEIANRRAWRVAIHYCHEHQMHNRKLVEDTTNV